MIKILREVLDFIKKPTDTRIENGSFRKCSIYLFALMSVELALHIILIFPILFLLDSIEPMVTELRIEYQRNTLIQTMVIGIVLVPILEELVFRYVLRYNKLISRFLKRTTWDKIFKYLVYISIILFGFAHSSNYENSSLFFYLLLPIIISSQLIGGIAITFLRVRFSMQAGIAYHVLWNMIFLLIPVGMNYLNKPFIREDTNYNLKIESLIYNSDKGQQYEVEADSTKIYKATISEYSLNHVLDSLFQYERKEDDQLIRLELESKSGISKEELKKELLNYGDSMRF